MTSIDELLARNRQLIASYTLGQHSAPTYRELEADRTSLIELVLMLVAERAENAGNKGYTEQLEASLKKSDEDLRSEKERTTDLGTRLDEAKRDLQHMTLAAKMYEAIAESAGYVVYWCDASKSDTEAH